jgi:hypothetical protein
MNASADEEANRGSLSRIGTIQVNGTTTSSESPMSDWKKTGLRAGKGKSHILEGTGSNPTK